MKELHQTCPYCKTEFVVQYKFNSSKPRIHCSQSCAAKTAITKRSDTSNPWTDAEIDKLKSWIGKKPLAQIQREWKKVAKKQGWEDRSDEAIHIKFARACRSQGLSEKPTSDNLSMQELAKRMDVPIDRVRRWRELGLKVGEYNCDVNGRAHIIAISKKELRKFACSHPEEFWGIDSKYLSKFLGDAKLARAIAFTVEQPTIGRAITIVRLDTGDVYRSAYAAGNALNIHKHNVLKVCKRSTPMRNGMDFVQLDYPVFWVPLVYRNDFNKLAGKVFYNIYLHTRSLDGFNKTTCTIVAGRMAVQIALFTFRKNFNEAKKGHELTPVDALAQFWTDRMLFNLNSFLSLDGRGCFVKTASVIKRIAYRTFVNFFAKSSNFNIQFALEDYAAYYIERTTQHYFKHSYLPRNYKPTTRLEKADLFTYIYGSVFASVQIREDYLERLGRVVAWGYLDKNYGHERVVDLSGTGIDDDDPSRGFQHHVTAIASCSENKDEYSSQQKLDDLLDYIDKSKSVSAQDKERLKLYVDLKLEECSDAEIAKVMEINLGDLSKLGSKLKKLAMTFQDTQGNAKSPSTQCTSVRGVY